MSEAALHIEVVSDVVCPWCLIGCRRLELAVQRVRAERGESLTVDWELHPFLLDPATPKTGVDLRARLRQKYGDPEPLFRRVEEAAHRDGIDLDFSRVQRSVDTTPAHTLIRHARDKGTQWSLGKALFGAYFIEGRDISDSSVLEGLAQSHGFASGEGTRLVQHVEELSQTRAAAMNAANQGIRGVPFVVLSGAGKPVALSGAQPVDVFADALRRVIPEKSPSPT